MNGWKKKKKKKKNVLLFLLSPAKIPCPKGPLRD